MTEMCTTESETCRLLPVRGSSAIPPLRVAVGSNVPNNAWDSSRCVFNPCGPRGGWSGWLQPSEAGENASALVAFSHPWSRRSALRPKRPGMLLSTGTVNRRLGEPPRPGDSGEGRLSSSNSALPGGTRYWRSETLSRSSRPRCRSEVRKTGAVPAPCAKTFQVLGRRSVPDPGKGYSPSVWRSPLSVMQ